MEQSENLSSGLVRSLPGPAWNWAPAKLSPTTPEPPLFQGHFLGHEPFKELQPTPQRKSCLAPSSGVIWASSPGTWAPP